MTTRNQGSIQKAFLLAGAIFIGWAANAQSSDSKMSTDTARHNPMHRNWDRSKGPGQNGGGRETHGWAHKGGVRHNNMHFTAEQRQQAMAINKDYKTKSAELFAKDNISLKEYKAGLIALRKDKKTKMAALLTPQQKEQMEQHKKMATENRQVMAAAHMERLKLRLNLTDDQVAKIKTGQESLHQEVKAIHENDNLLPQQKMEQMKGLMAKRDDIYKSVLTPDQLSTFEKMKQHHRGFGEHGERGGRGQRGGDRGGNGGDRGPRHPMTESMQGGSDETAI